MCKDYDVFSRWENLSLQVPQNALVKNNAWQCSNVESSEFASEQTVARFDFWLFALLFQKYQDLAQVTNDDTLEIGYRMRCEFSYSISQ